MYLRIALLTILLTGCSQAELFSGVSLFNNDGGMCVAQGTLSASCSIEEWVPGPAPGEHQMYWATGSAQSSYGHVSASVESFGLRGVSAASFDEPIRIVGGSGFGWVQYILTGSYQNVTDIGGWFAIQSGPDSEVKRYTNENSGGPLNYESKLYPFEFGSEFRFGVTASPWECHGITGSLFSTSRSPMFLYTTQT